MSSENKYLVTLYVVMNDQGEYAVHHDADTAVDAFNEDYSGPYEVTEIEISMSAPPSIARKVSAELPDDPEGGKFTLTLDKADEA